MAMASARFPRAQSRPFWGGGVRGGLVYSVNDCLDLGFGYTSEEFFEPWIYHVRTELGLPRTLVLNASLPAIYSWGASYLANENWRLSVHLALFRLRQFRSFRYTGRAGRRPRLEEHFCRGVRTPAIN